MFARLLQLELTAVLNTISIPEVKICFGDLQTYKTTNKCAIVEQTLPPPLSPQFGQLGPLFSDVKIQDLKVSLELKNTLYTL